MKCLNICIKVSYHVWNLLERPFCGKSNIWYKRYDFVFLITADILVKSDTLKMKCFVCSSGVHQPDVLLPRDMVESCTAK